MPQLFSLFLGLILSLSAYAQDNAYLKTKITNKTLLPNTEVLKWIKTSQDFDQANLSTQEIDRQIARVIQKQKSTPVAEIVTPINLKKLAYYGYLDFKKTGIVTDSELFTSQPDLYADADGPRNIFQYGNLTLLTTYNSYEDQLHVYSIIRSFIILQYKYPEIYEALFLNTALDPRENPQIVKDKSNPGVYNANPYFVVSIHENPKKASNATTSYFSPQHVDPISNSWLADKNVHVIFFHKETLRNGGVYTGGIPMYPSLAKADAHIRFLRDGLLQTLVHERLHNYVSNYAPINQMCDFMRNDASLITGNGSTYRYLEEPIITHTVNTLFESYGGMSTEVMQYYQELFDKTQLPELKSNTRYQEVLTKLQKINPKSPSPEERDLLRIYF